jgi:hypothetical protein
MDTAMTAGRIMHAELKDAARSLHTHLVERLGHGAVSVGITDDLIHCYLHRRLADRDGIKENWAGFPVEVRYVGPIRLL